MKKYCFIILILLSGCSAKANVKSNVVNNGIFNCVIEDKYILFFENKSEDESSLFNLMEIELSSGKKIEIADNIFSKQLMQLSDYLVAYTNGQDIFSYDVRDNVRKSIFKAKENYKIVGFQAKSKCDSILVIQVDYNKNSSWVSIFDNKTKKTVYEHEIGLNPEEMEGVAPIIVYKDDAFIFSMQSNLYAILVNKTMEIKLLCSKCDTYAFNNTGLIYYQFVTSEMTEAYYINTNTWISVISDQSLNKEIYNCSTSNLFTTLRKGNYIPCYIICGVPYVLENTWEKVLEIIVYEDKNLKIELLKDKYDKICDTGFAYKFMN